MDKIKQFDWSGSTNPKIEGEFFPPDKLGRAKYASFLTNLLASEGFDESRSFDSCKRNYVLNLNAEWGAGKTYFLKRWSQDLKSDYPVVYVDAWKQDYSDDPFLTVISSIISQLGIQAEFEIKVPKSAVSMFKAVAPAIAQGVVKKVLNTDFDEICNLLADDDLSDEEGGDPNTKQSTTDFSPAAKALAENLIKEHEAKSKSIEVIKSKLSIWVNKFEEQNGIQLPIFIFIDELDRCRPSYAVEMLETIKHIFDVKGIVFVVATDTEQLQHTIKAIYGQGFSAQMYLGRFFNSRYSLKRPALNDFLTVHTDVTKYEPAYLKSREVRILPVTDTPEIALKNISIVLDAFQISARTAIQITDRIAAIISNLNSGNKVDILVLAILFCLLEKDYTLYANVINGTFDKKEQNNKGEFRTVGLVEFIKRKMNNAYLERKLTYNFKTNIEFNDLNLRHPGYGESIYLISLSQFMDTIFSEIFSKGANTALSAFLSYGREEQSSPLEKAVTSLRRHNPSNDKQDVTAKLLIQYMYLRDGFSEITPENYGDFIELSSPLEHMGES